MVLATAAYATLPLPLWCDVPAGALNHTGVRKVSMSFWAIVRESAIAVLLAARGW